MTNQPHQGDESNLHNEIKELKQSVDSKFNRYDDKLDKIVDSATKNSNLISSLEGSLNAANSYIRGRFESNDNMFRYFNSEISKIKSLIKDYEGDLEDIKKEIVDLRTGIWGKSSLGEPQTVTEKFLNSGERLNDLSEKMDRLQQSLSLANIKIDLLENEKDGIKKIVTDFTTKSVYEMAMISAYKSSKLFVVKRWLMIRITMTKIAERLFYSAIFRILIAILTIVLTAPVVEELRKFVEKLLLELSGN